MRSYLLKNLLFTSFFEIYTQSGTGCVLHSLNLAMKLKFSRSGICSRQKDGARLYGVKLC